MPHANYVTQEIRASAATSGTSGQDTAVTLPESVSSFDLRVSKTAETGTNPVITIRLQCDIGGFYVDVPYDTNQQTTGVTVAVDGTVSTTKTPNILDSNGSATFTWTAHYTNLPSNIVRTIWIASGTAPTHTWSAVASYPMNRL